MQQKYCYDNRLLTIFSCVSDWLAVDGGVMVNRCGNTIQNNDIGIFILLHLHSILFFVLCNLRNLCPMPFLFCVLIIILFPFTSDHLAALGWWNLFVFKLTYESVVLMNAQATITVDSRVHHTRI